MSNERSFELTEAISRMVSQYSFYAMLMFELLTIKETDALPTAGTDGIDLMVNPDFFNPLTREERIFILIHEVLHVVYRHPQRMALYQERGFGPDLKPYNQTKMNVACDYIINDAIVKSGLKDMPHGGLLNPQYTCDMLADDVYCLLPDPPQDQGGDDGTGNWDKHMPQAKDKPGPTEADVKRALKSAEQVAKAQGNLPAHLERLVNDICEPQIDWAEQIKLSVSTCAGRDESTWARPNRKRLAIYPHMYLPGTSGHRAGIIALASDSSGSVSSTELSHYFGEMSSIVEELNPEQTWISDCSTQCAEFLEADSPDDVRTYTLRTGGGTHMPDIFRQLEDQQIVPDVLVILTDGYTDFGTAPGYPVIWVITSPGMEADHGKTIHIKVTGE